MKKNQLIKLVFLISLFALMAAGCEIVELKQEVPASPKESYEPLPR